MSPSFVPSRSLFALGAACALGLAACGPKADAPSPPQPAPAAAPEPVAAPPQALDRAALLAAMDAAAAAYAGGQSPGGDGLVGRRFVVRQAFGCQGPVASAAASADGLARAAWRGEPGAAAPPGDAAIELSLTPGDWKASPLMTGGAAGWEAVEGMWLARPWLPTDACPDMRPDPLAAGPAAASPQTMGLAAVFEADGSRLGQRKGRAYSHLVRGKAGQPPAAPEGGWRLVLEGRLVSFADGRAVHCRAGGADQRPVCVAAARLDRVAFEDAAGETLSEWSGG